MNLTALQHSPFLQSLGWAIANSLWQAAALWIAYHLVNGMYKNASSKFKNNFSTILLSITFIWFCITLFTKYFTLQNLPVALEIPLYQTNSAHVSAYNWNDILNKVTATLPYLSVAYLLLLIFLSLRLINVYRFTRFIKLNGLQKPGVEWKLFTERVATHMGIAKKVRLWVSHHVDVPATIGFLKPIILIPLASINQLSQEQMEAIILHELSHIKRNDYLINLFVSIIETILFFNPFAVLLARVIKRERENCCDDFVIQYQYDRHSYASALLSLEQYRNLNLKLAIGATSNKKQLLVRIKRIMEINSNTNFNYGQKLAALLLITGIICSVAWLSPQTSERKKLELSKSIQKISERKLIKEAQKPVFLKEINTEPNNVTTAPIKTQAKTERSQCVNELQAMNLKEIADRELNRANFLVQESKKQVPGKIMQKYNLTKLLIGNNAFRNSPSFYSYTNNVLFNRQQVYAADIKKLQAELEKYQVTFDYDDMQENVKQAFNQQELKTTLLHLNQNLKESDMERLIKITTKNTGENILRKVQAPRTAKTSSVTGSGTYYLADSLIETEIKVVNGHAKLFTARINTKANANNETASASRQLLYSFNYDDYDESVNDEDKNKKTPEKTYKGAYLSYPDFPATPNPVIHYRVKETPPNEDNNPAKVTVPKTRIIRTRDNVSVEYKDGLIIINGKQINTPVTNRLLAIALGKSKKLNPAEKPVINIDIND